MSLITQMADSSTTKRTSCPTTTAPDNWEQTGTNCDKLGQKLDVADQTNGKLEHPAPVKVGPIGLIKQMADSCTRPRTIWDKLGQNGINWDRNSLRPLTIWDKLGQIG